MQLTIFRSILKEGNIYMINFFFFFGHGQQRIFLSYDNKYMIQLYAKTIVLQLKIEDAAIPRHKFDHFGFSNLRQNLCSNK